MCERFGGKERSGAVRKIRDVKFTVEPEIRKSVKPEEGEPADRRRGTHKQFNKGLKTAA